MHRIKLANLEHLVQRINEATNSPLTYSTKIDGKHSINIGHYHLDGAYGGWKLVRTMNDGGGIDEITYGYCSKRELYDKMLAFLSGIYAAQESA